MKKSIVFVSVVIALAVSVTGCESTPSPEKNNAVSSNAPGSPSYPDINVTGASNLPRENNTSVDAYATRIVDWDGRTIGEPRTPGWLRTMIRGNGTMYTQAYGLDQVYGTHRWFIANAQSPSQATAETLASTNLLDAVAQEMFTTISSTLGRQLSGGQLAAIRTVCAQTDATLTGGVGRRGQYWQREVTADEYGNQTRLYNYYIFYSCDEMTYQNLLATYMHSLLNDRGLDEDTVNKISQNRAKIIQDALDRSKQREAEKERELIRQRDEYMTHRTLSDNQTRQVEAQERTAQVQARTQSNAAISESRANAAAAVTSATGSSVMSPALAALLSEL